LSCHCEAVILTGVHSKQIRKNIIKKQKKDKIQTIQNSINASTLISKQPHNIINTQTLQNRYITKQVKTTTVQHTQQMNESQYNPYPKHKLTIMNIVISPQELNRNTSLHL
jgi:mannitol-specific phosphotransferase system IIBC component